MKELTPTSKITLKEILEICEGMPLIIQDSFGNEIFADDSLAFCDSIKKVEKKYGNWTVYALDIENDRLFQNHYPQLILYIWNP